MLDLRASLVRLTGEIQIGELEKHLYDTLSQSGFLEDEQFEAMRSARVSEFTAAPRREAAHSGSAYPDTAEEAKKALDEFLQGAQPAGSEDSQIAIAAPHVSPFGGWESYRDAYATLPASLGERTFVVLGTSHYGEPDRFGLTRKPFVTPFGEAVTDLALVNELEQAAPGAVRMEDYCHAVEHSIEFQVLFLQHVFGPNLRILPILCGSFARSIFEGGKPEDEPRRAAVFRQPGQHRRQGRRRSCSLCWAWTWRTWAAAMATSSPPRPTRAKCWPSPCATGRASNA